MINTTALEPLRDNWNDIKASLEDERREHAAQIMQLAKQQGIDEGLDEANDALGNVNTAAVDAIQKFSEDNGFEYLGDIGQDYAKFGYEGYVNRLAQHQPGMVMGAVAPANADKMPAWMRANGLPNVQRFAVSGKIRQYSTLMFVDRVTVTYGGSDVRDERYSYSGVIVVQLNKIFPQIVLDSNKNDSLFMKTRSASIVTDQKIDLEGNFSHYFDFYAPKGINANSLTVLAPNFMQMLIDSSATFDVEFFGDKMYITTQSPLFTHTVMNDACNALDEQLKYMERLEQSWNYQPLILPFDVLKNTKMVNFYALKIGSYRLGMGQLIIAFALLFFVFAFVVPVLSAIWSL